MATNWPSHEVQLQNCIWSTYVYLVWAQVRLLWHILKRIKRMILGHQSWAIYWCPNAWKPFRAQSKQLFDLFAIFCQVQSESKKNVIFQTLLRPDVNQALIQQAVHPLSHHRHLLCQWRSKSPSEGAATAFDCACGPGLLSHVGERSWCHPNASKLRRHSLWSIDDSGAWARKKTTKCHAHFIVKGNATK